MKRTARIPIDAPVRSGLIRHFALLAMLLVPAAACDDPLEPGEVADVYTLESVAGAPLPAVLIETESFRFHVHADELRLNRDRTGHRITTGIGEALVEGGTQETMQWESALVFRLAGARIEIEMVCPPNALCAPPPHLIARRVSGGILVESPHGQHGPLMYVSASDRE